MFGIIYTAIMFIGFVGYQIKNAIDEQQCINEGKRKRKEGKNFANVYTDRRGGMRSLATGRRVSIDNLSEAESNGRDCFMRDVYGNPIRNMSEEMREERYNNALHNRDPQKTVVKWKRGIPKNLTGVDGRPYYSGPEFKDLDTGQIYICRFLPIPFEISQRLQSHGEYYMRIEDGLLERESDSQKEARRLGEYDISEDINQKFISYFNSKQETEGYYASSKVPYVRENDFLKEVRLGAFYCNDYESHDV